MCLSENSLAGSAGGGGDVGGGGGRRMGDSSALAAARKDSSSEAVTRTGEVQTRRRMVGQTDGRSERAGVPGAPPLA